MPDRHYQDDPTILNEDALWRRIPPWHFIRDDNAGRTRPSSAAFDEYDMSVVIAKNSRGSESALANHVGFALAAITAGLARDNGQGVASDPTTEEPAHGIVFGNKTKTIKKRLAGAAEWVIPPPSSP